MTTEEFNILIEKNQPHEVFKLDWNTYYPIDFADTFLPKVGGYQCKGVKFFDGAELLNGLKASPRKLLPLSESNKLISIITATFPKDVEAGLKKDRVQPANHEIATFIEVDQAEKATVSFKFGNNFKDFVSKQNLSIQALEQKKYETDLKTIQEHFQKTLSHENMMEFVLKTIGINSSTAYGNTDKGKLETLLRENKIESFIYKNKCSKTQSVIVQGTIVQGLLVLNYIHNSEIDNTTNLKLSELNSFIAFKKDNVWKKSELAIPENYNEGSCPDLQTAFSESEKTHIAKLVTQHINFTKLDGAEKQYEALNNEIAKQLNNPFYDNVNLCVNLEIIDNSISKPTQVKPLDGVGPINLPNNTKTFTSTFKKNDKPSEVSLEITIGSDEKPIIKHKVSPNYLKEFEGKWEQEIKKRGLENEINITELRDQVLEDFVSAETEHSFYERFIQSTKALLNEQIGGYVEAIQATQKIAKNVWDEGQVNESTWHSNKDGLSEEHQQWPTYVQLEPVIGGATDGVIDEIVGIPMAIKGVYGVATDEKQREAIKKLFTKEGLSNMLDGLKDEVEEIKNDEQKAGHFGAKTTISVASMMVPGMQITKIGKVGEVIDTATDGLKKVTNPKTLKGVDDLKAEIKYLPENKNEIPNFLENRKGKKEFLENVEIEILDDLGEDIAKIVKKGENADVLIKARLLPGTSTGQGKIITGKWLKGSAGNAGLFPKSVADKLKGKQFNNFDEFRQQFWKTVAEDADLSPQFSVQNLAKMKNGNAPTPLPEQWLGGQTSYILHHKTPINQGGAVYDMDNLYIVTPRFHKEILAPEFHFGYGY